MSGAALPKPAGGDTKSTTEVPSGLSTLRLLTCGSVDDGKSTLIGRLLWEQGVVPDDQLAALERDTRRYGTTGEAIDFALLVDGLEAERQQGITIDVAYRYFQTARRAFIVADTPGHEQYTRNMATGASNASLAVLLVDARKGLLSQTRRHAAIVSLFGIRSVVLAVNKMDLVEYDEAVFVDITEAFGVFAAKLDFAEVVAIPLSARHGDNLSTPSAAMPWYVGPSLIDHLERVDVEVAAAERAFRMPVQWINRPNPDFRGFSGTVASGRITCGDEVVVARSGRTTTLARIVTADGDRTHAAAGEAVTLVLAEEVDIGRGDVLADVRARPQVGTEFSADLIWMSEAPLRLKHSYLLKLATCTVPAMVTVLDHRLAIDTLMPMEATTLHLNEVGRATLTTAAPIAFDPYKQNSVTGAFILIDRDSNETSAAGTIVAGVRRATNVYRQDFAVTRTDRARLKHQRPAVLWFTGLSGSGKSTIANMVEGRLSRAGFHTAILDGDNVRHGLSRDLGFSQVDRNENIRRVAEVARLMTDSGLLVLCSFISPFRAERTMARAVMAEGEFLEIFVDVPLETCMSRDSKGLYRRALAGEIKDFTGIDQPYEAPEKADLIIGQNGETAESAADRIMEMLVARGFLR